jgi:hypothetical protein
MSFLCLFLSSIISCLHSLLMVSSVL